MLDIVKFPQIVFKSERVRMTGSKSMEISGTLTLNGITRPLVLTATFNGGRMLESDFPRTVHSSVRTLASHLEYPPPAPTWESVT